MSKKVLVYGWCGQKNLGDMLFEEAFSHLFPDYHFTYTSHLTCQQLEGQDAVFIGGGSFLEFPLNIDSNAWLPLHGIPIFYLGVGAETNIHPDHLHLIKMAKLIAIRTNHIEKIAAYNTNVMMIPDLVYCLPVDKYLQTKPNSILIIPNISVVPRCIDPHWKHSAWNYFKSEFCQFLDCMVAQKYSINFLPMCSHPELSDHAAAIEIINGTSHRSKCKIQKQPKNLQEATQVFSQYSLIITQRFHGIILANMVNVPVISIQHHDKLKNCSTFGVSYYGLNKNLLIDQVNDIKSRKNNNILPIERNSFIDLKQRVNNALCGS